MRYTRHRAGRGFTYRDAAKETVKDKELIAFFRSLAIPPAWTKVKISRSDRAKIHATGYDAKGRKQYVYNRKYRRVQEQCKFDRILRFARELGNMREVVQTRLRRRKLDRDKVMATMVRLLDIAHFRPGNDCYAKQNKSYGLTTLRNKHLRIEGDVMIFDYQGKSSKRQEKVLVDGRLTKIVREINELPGYEIFKFIDETGTVQDVKSQDLNAYIREIMGAEFSAKDFRTWAGTLIAAETLDKIGVAEGVSMRQLKRNIRTAVDAVSEALGNTPAIARKSYIGPRVIEHYMDGRTLYHCSSEVNRLRNKTTNLSVQELGLLCLLEQDASTKHKRL